MPQYAANARAGPVTLRCICSLRRAGEAEEDHGGLCVISAVRKTLFRQRSSASPQKTATRGDKSRLLEPDIKKKLDNLSKSGFIAGCLRRRLTTRIRTLRALEAGRWKLRYNYAAISSSDDGMNRSVNPPLSSSFPSENESGGDQSNKRGCFNDLIH